MTGHTPRNRRDVIKILSAAGVAIAVAPFTKAAGLAAAGGLGSVSIGSEAGQPAASNDTARARTALVIVDSYNDFLSDEGLTWRLVRLVAEENGLVQNLLRLVAVARTSGARIAFAPHYRYREGSFSDRKYLNPSQHQQLSSGIFAEGKFGGQFYAGLGPVDGDIVSSEHVSSSGFSETDLHDQLAKESISHLFIAGCISNTCIEATARSAVDLGYHVTIVTDAIAAFSPVDHALATQSTFPLVVHRTVSTAEAVRELGA